MASEDPGNGYAAVVFDLWGTLVPFRAAVLNEAMARIASELGAGLDAFRMAWHAGYAERMVGDLQASLRSACHAAGVSADDAAIRRAAQIRRDAQAAMFVPRPEAAPTLRRLRSLGYRTGLITNSTSEVPQLWQDGPLSALVDATVFSCSEGLRKPDPAIYELASARLGTETRRCVFVGDGGDDELAGASAAGMRAVLLRPGDTSPREWAGPAIALLSDVFAHLTRPVSGAEN
jgi:putative hydrolase of the HAD superfamily